MAVSINGPGTRCTFSTDAARQVVVEISIWRPAKHEKSIPEEKPESIRRTKRRVEIHEVKVEAGPAFLGAYASLFLTGSGQACACAGKEGHNACKLLFYRITPRKKEDGGEEKQNNGLVRSGVMARCMIESLQGEAQWKAMCQLNLFDLVRLRDWARERMSEIDVFGSFVITREPRELMVRVGGGASIPLQTLSADAAGYLGAILTGAKTKGFTRDQFSIYPRNGGDGVSVVVGGMRAVVQSPAELHRLMLHFERGANASA